MSLRIPSRSAGGAWLMSLPIALALPAGAWLLLVGSSAEDLIYLGIAVVTHLTAYAVTGIPIFGRYYPSPRARIWEFRHAVLCGGALGAPGSHLAFLLFAPGVSMLPDAKLALIGSGYGVCTAVAAWLARPCLGGVSRAAAAE